MALRIRFQYPTNATLGYSIERLSDGLLYDFADGTFKAAPTTIIEGIPEDTGSFLGRYKATLTPTPVAQFADGHYAVTVHDVANKNMVAAELACSMVNGDDSPAADQILTEIAALTLAVNAPRPLIVGSAILPAH